MKNVLYLVFFLIVNLTASYAQSVAVSPQLKTFQQTLAASNIQFVFPKEFKEIKLVNALEIDYAIELPKENFQVWFKVKGIQPEPSKAKGAEDEPKQNLASSDSLYNSVALTAATKLAGKDNYTYKSLPPDALAFFNADQGRSYQLNLRDMPQTNHYKYALLISLQKNEQGSIFMLFLGNENGPGFYKKVNKAYYSVKFN
jgi:hypothetical protein